jgi:hypothetical protein
LNKKEREWTWECPQCGRTIEEATPQLPSREKVLHYLKRLQRMLGSGETYCFDNEFDLADARDLQALIEELE